jgi:hypothetical protein
MTIPTIKKEGDRELVLSNLPAEEHVSADADGSTFPSLDNQSQGEVVDDAEWATRRARVAARLGTYEGPGWEAVLQGIERDAK